VNGDTATRPLTTPVDTVSSGTHSDGSASARTSGNSTHTQDHVRILRRTHTRNSVNNYRVTFIHPTNQTVSRFYERLTVTISKTFYAAVSHKLSRDSISVTLDSISPLKLIHSLDVFVLRAPDRSVT